MIFLIIIFLTFFYQLPRRLRVYERVVFVFHFLISHNGLIFSDISEWNNNYSDTLDFRRGWVGEVGVVTFFVLKVPDYESAMLIYLLLNIYEVTIQVAVLIRFSWNSHGWCGATHGWTLLFLETIGPIEPQIWGENVPPKPVFRV